MHNTSILAPLFALAFWTFAILILVPIVRFKASFAGKAKARDFKLGETETLPEWVRLPNRNYMNLLELPILFYVVGILFFIQPNEYGFTIPLMWAYFGFRVLHSIIHITINHIYLRLISFAISNFILIALWVICAKTYGIF